MAFLAFAAMAVGDGLERCSDLISDCTTQATASGIGSHVASCPKTVGQHYTHGSGIGLELGPQPCRQPRVWLAANDAGVLDDYRHIPFKLDELALDAAARGLGVAMTDLTLAAESIARGVLVVPLGEPLATGGVYALCLQPLAASHPGCQTEMKWFGLYT